MFISRNVHEIFNYVHVNIHIFSKYSHKFTFVSHNVHEISQMFH